jgi:hypothetical protein
MIRPRSRRSDVENRVPHYSAEDVRGGEILLRTRTQRLIFIAGLAGAALLGLLAYGGG